MEIGFKTQSLRTLCESEEVMRRTLGPTATEALKVCLADMRVAATIGEVVSYERSEVPESDGRSLSIDLSNGYRVVVCANHVRNPFRLDGKVDWSSVSRIKIMSIKHDD